jgi:hypothetical protein
MVECGIARDAKEPARERNRTLLILLDGRQQLHEDVLRDVLGGVVVADDVGDVAVDVVRVADIEEVQGIHVARLRAGDRVSEPPVRAGIGVRHRLSASWSRGGVAPVSEKVRPGAQ